MPGLRQAWHCCKRGDQPVAAVLKKAHLLMDVRGCSETGKLVELLVCMTVAGKAAAALWAFSAGWGKPAPGFETPIVVQEGRTGEHS